MGIFLAQCRNNVASFIEAESSLCQISHTIRIRHGERFDLGGRADDLCYRWGFTKRANNFVMVAVSNQNARVAFLGKLYCLHVNLGHQGTSCIDHPQSPGFAGFSDLRRDTVGTIDDTFAIRDLVYAVHENRTLALEFLNHETIVHNFLAHVDGRTERLQGDANDIDGPDNPGAKATGLQQQQCFALRHSSSHSLWMLSRVHVPHYACLEKYRN